MTPQGPRIDKTKTKRSSYADLLLHIHPRRVPEQTIGLNHTWGLGGMAALLVMLQVFSGILLLFVYQPIAASAYGSVENLLDDVLFGRFMRKIHYWAANILVVTAFLHLLRVFFTGAFQTPRRFNWVIGLCLFGLVLAANFTGYLLPWDQLAYWAVTISTGMMDYIPGVGSYLQHFVRGGDEVGPATLSNFFVCHVILVPMGLLLLMPYHFWRVRKAGGVIAARRHQDSVPPPNRRVPVFPDLVVREMAVGLVLMALVFTLSAFFDAPLESQANPGLSPNPAKPPWYFAGFQELLLHVHPLYAVVVIPGVVFAGLVALPYLRHDAHTAGIWFRSPRGLRSGIRSGFAGAVCTAVAVVLDERFISSGDVFNSLSSSIWRGAVPLAVFACALTGKYVFARRKSKATGSEIIQSTFVLILAVFIMLTVIGVWFRGPFMKLGWY